MNAPFGFTNDFPAVPTQEERALSLIEDVIWSHRLRLREEPIFAEGLRMAVSKWTRLFGSKWACDTVETGRSILAAKFANVPHKTMDQLSEELFILASNSHRPNCPNRALASLLAGWLKANVIEELGENSVRRAARQVKSDYELFFERLLADHRSAC